MNPYLHQWDPRPAAWRESNVFLRLFNLLKLNRNQPPIRNAAYGPSKAVVNWLTIRINTEDEWLNAFVLCPGWVQTDLGNEGARGLGFEKAMLGVDESCNGMMDVLTSSSKEKHGGKMVSYDGEILGW